MGWFKQWFRKTFKPTHKELMERLQKKRERLEVHAAIEAERAKIRREKSKAQPRKTTTQWASTSTKSIEPLFGTGAQDSIKKRRKARKKKAYEEPSDLFGFDKFYKGLK